MSNAALTLDEIRHLAADIGLTRLTDAQLQELLRATNAARARRDQVNFDALTLADEPAHVLRYTTGTTA